MGYYSKHKLHVISGNDNVTDYEKEIGEVSDYGNCFDEEIKWYSREEDMKSYSLKHPETVFCIFRTGEESGDVTWHFYSNGKEYTEHADFNVPAFNSDKLK